jgi:hypothetical protein
MHKDRGSVCAHCEMLKLVEIVVKEKECRGDTSNDGVSAGKMKGEREIVSVEMNSESKG